MANIKKSATELIGNTPLLEVTNYAEANKLTDATILVKLEYLNPAGSVKDRIALNMIEDAEKKGLLKPGQLLLSRPQVIPESDWQQWQRQKDIKQYLHFLKQ